MEIETAFSRRIPIIPLLVEGATMPKARALPESLEPLAFINAAEIRASRGFREDVARLVEHLGGLVA